MVAIVLLFGLSAGALALGTFLRPDGAVDDVSGLQIGQSRRGALDAFDGAGFYGWTCFRELAAYGDVEVDGGDHHVMAFVDGAADRVDAVEVAAYPVGVADRSQCMAAVRHRAEEAFAHIDWSGEQPGRYFIGGGNRYFLRRQHGNGRVYEIWADHRGAASHQTCRVFWRVSTRGQQRLEASGERRKRNDLAAVR